MHNKKIATPTAIFCFLYTYTCSISYKLPASNVLFPVLLRH